MVLNEQEIIYQIALLQIERVGPSIARQFIDKFGSAKDVFNASSKELLEFGVIGNIVAKGREQAEIQAIAVSQLRFAEGTGVQVLSYYDKQFPRRLKHCSDSPLLLYQRGNVNLNQERTVAIVGTRQCSDYGKSFCQRFVSQLASYNPLIISGLAYGIDKYAHQNAVENQIQNSAVLAHGLDRVYPTEHRGLAEQIMKNGSLITEYKTNTNPDRENFPKRNRIVAGMADAIVIIESAFKGGSMITAKLGNDYNRDVFALPGRINDKQSAGCNHLIKTNQAHLLQSAEDMAYILGWKKSDTDKKITQRQLFVDLNQEESKIMDALQLGNLSIDEIAASCSLPISVASTQLLMLEFKGLTKQLPGKIYQLS